jgi:hypothetical protein
MAALVLAIGAAPALADDDEPESAPKPAPRPVIRWSPYAAKVLGIDQQQMPKDPKPPAKSSKSKSEAKKPAPQPKPKALPETAKIQAEQAALIRRLAVCDKLKEIALRTNDNDLLQRAEQLDARAWATYTQRTGASRSGDGAAYSALDPEKGSGGKEVNR